MYKIIDVFGCAHKEPMSFEKAIQVLRSDMYLTEKDIEAAKQSDKFTFVYGFVSSHIERVDNV